MSSIQRPAYTKGYKQRLQKKTKEFLDEASDACSLIENISSQLQERTRNVLALKDANFFHEYEKLQKYLDNLSEKLFLAVSIVTDASEEDQKISHLSNEDSSSISESSLCPSETLVDTHPNSNRSQDIQLQESNANVSKALEIKNTSTDTSRNLGRPVETSISNLTSVEAEVSGECDPCIAEQHLPQVHPSDLTAHASEEFTPTEACVNYSKPPCENASSCCITDSHIATAVSIASSCCITDSHIATAVSIASATSHADIALTSAGPKSIQSADVSVGSTVTAIVTHIKTPTNFWIQLDNPVLDQLILSCDRQPIPSSLLQDVKYCLAPWKFNRSSFRRAEIMSRVESEHSPVNVLYVDYGSTTNVYASELMLLPDSLYLQPVQAIHCYLPGIKPMDDTWSPAALERFQYLMNSDFNIKATVLSHSKEDNLYYVSLDMHIFTPKCIEILDVREMLEMHAILEQEAVQSMSKSSETDETSPEPDDSNGSEISDCRNKLEMPSISNQNTLSQALYCQNVCEKECVSDDMVTPEQLALEQQSEIFNKTQLDCSINGQLENDEDDNMIFFSDTDDDDDMDIISNNLEEASQATLSSAQLSSGEPSISQGENETSNLIELHDVIVPPAQPCFLEENKMIILPSEIYSPTYFYANVATSNSTELDELCEHMTAEYDRLESSDGPSMEVKEVQKKMFLACRYSDKNWYRVQVNDFWPSEDSCSAITVAVVYIDFGNEDTVSIKELRQLLEKYAHYPTMAVLCMLAHIKPTTYENNCNGDPNLFTKFKWDRAATERFSELTRKGKVFTAEIHDTQRLDENRILYKVLLWYVDNGDKLVNHILVEEKYAKYIDVRQLSSHLALQFSSRKSNLIENIDGWNPMAEDFNSVMNSYSVDPEDASVAITGYKANDEKYICKYYASNRKCYRGDKCLYQHIETSHDDATADKESVFAYGNVLALPDPGSYCLVQVSCLLAAGHFYVVFPYGTTSLDQVDISSDWYKGGQREFEQLNIDMNKHYSKAPFAENTGIAPALGTIVAAKASFDDCWYRAKIIEVEDVVTPVKVFFVDFGIKEYVDRRNIRELQKQFLLCPFQAVESFLANVEPHNEDGSSVWSQESKAAVQKLVEGKVLLAFVNQKIDSLLFLSLMLTTKQSRANISNFLVEEGHAQFTTRRSVNCFDENEYLKLSQKKKKMIKRKLMEPG